MKLGELSKGSLKRVQVFSSPWAVVALFAFLGLIGILNHVMWRDEFNTWLIVRDSQSLGEMLGRVKYQGHAPLWSLSVSFLRNFSASPRIMQLFHWAIAVLSITVFWRHSPFSHRQKVLFTFGYIPFYQYLLIARPYVLGMAFLFIFCAVFPYRKKSYLPAAVMLALMACSSAYSLFIATGLLAALGVELIVDPQQRSRCLQQGWGDLALSLLVVAIGFGFTLYILIPPADSYNHGGIDAWKFNFDLRRLLRAWGRLYAGYTLIVPSGQRWLDLMVSGAMTVVAVAAFVLKLVKKPVALCFLTVASGIILAFTYFRFMGGGPRHYGHFYLVLVAAFWLASYLPESDGLARRLRLPAWALRFGQTWHLRFLTAILVIQFLGGLYGLPRDLLIPFSASREAVNFIRASGWQDEFIVASRDANMAAISGYLDRKLYYPEQQGLGSFTLFGGDRAVIVSQEEVLRQIQGLLEAQPPGERILLILHKPLDTASPQLAITPIREFTRAWTDTERYHLYWVTLSGQASEPASHLPNALSSRRAFDSAFYLSQPNRFHR